MGVPAGARSDQVSRPDAGESVVEAGETGAPAPVGDLPADASTPAGPESAPERVAPPRPAVAEAALRTLRWFGRHRIVAALVVLVLVVSPWEASFASALAGGPGSVSARAAEWVRDHGGASIVAGVENFWYSHHQPPKGGRPPKGAIPAPSRQPTASSSAPAASYSAPPPQLPVPAPIPPLASPALYGEGVWHAAGRTVGGVPAVYEAYLRPDAVHTSLVAGVAWMDTKLLRATLYSGSYIPGDGPWADTAPVGPGAATSLVAAFNSGFRLADAEGGYYSEGRMVAPLRDGAASIVIYRDGTITVGQWGRDVTMGPDVVGVRQNLKLLVDNGAPVSGLADGAWGATLRNKDYVWRSGLGVTSDGALVYAAGPGLNVPSLASLLVKAGAVRAMELDINTDWVNFSTYGAGATESAPASGTNAATLLTGMQGGPSRYFTPSWNRDFLTMSSRNLSTRGGAR